MKTHKRKMSTQEPKVVGIRMPDEKQFDEAKRKGHPISATSDNQGFSPLELADIRGSLNSSGTKAWIKVTHLFRAAKNDPAIKINPQCVEFLDLIETMSQYAWGGWDVDRVLTPLVEAIKSERARTARGARTAQTTALIQARALELYDAQTWPSIAAAAREIYPALREFANEIPNAKYPSSERIAKTLGDWINKRKKSTANL